MSQESALRIYKARDGYNLVASTYEAWKWYSFWRDNEGPLIRKWLSNINKESVILDAGCGNSPYLIGGVSISAHKILIDISEGMLDVAKKKLSKINKVENTGYSSTSLVQSDLLNIPIKNNSVDYVLCSRVLSNISDFRTVLKEISRVSKSGARLLFTDIHPSHTYDYTGIDTVDGRINIETYKHSINSLLNAAPIYDLKLIDHQEYSYVNLFKPPDIQGFEKLYKAPTLPIFYTLEFQKR